MKAYPIKLLFVFFLVFSFLVSWGEPYAAETETVVTYAIHKPSKVKDKQYIYVFNLLEKALERTTEKYGTARLVRHEDLIPKARQIAELSRPGKRTIDVLYTSSSLEKEEKMCPVRIPLLKGILGYRIFLIKKSDQAKFAGIQTLEELKKYSVGQGKKWSDVKILEHNGFTVVKGNKNTLHKMLVEGRFDFFSRGINEAPVEYASNVKELPELHVEETQMLYYPLLRYFFFSKEDKQLVKRVEEGLQMLIEDGTFDRMVNEYTSEFLSKVQLKGRKLYKIDNPFAGKEIPADRAEFWFDPLR